MVKKNNATYTTAAQSFVDQAVLLRAKYMGLKQVQQVLRTVWNYQDSLDLEPLIAYLFDHYESVTTSLNTLDKKEPYSFNQATKRAVQVFADFCKRSGEDLLIRPKFSQWYLVSWVFAYNLTDDDKLNLPELDGFDFDYDFDNKNNDDSDSNLITQATKMALIKLANLSECLCYVRFALDNNNMRIDLSKVSDIIYNKTKTAAFSAAMFALSGKLPEDLEHFVKSSLYKFYFGPHVGIMHHLSPYSKEGFYDDATYKAFYEELRAAFDLP